MGKIFEALERVELEKTQPQDTGLSVLDSASELVILARPGSVIAEKFRFLRSRIVRPSDNQMRRTLLITSALKGEGKTFTASNLAVALAQGLDEYVLLVDADLRFPRLHTIFGYEATAPGLSDYLLDDISLAEALQKPGISNEVTNGKLSLLPAGQGTSNPHELLSSQRMRRFITEVRDRYPDRFILFDSPPLELAPESLVIAHEVDGIYLVVRRAKTPRESIKASKERIPRENFLGIVFNGHEISKKYYARKGKKSGYGYGYGYGYSYGSQK